LLRAFISYCFLLLAFTVTANDGTKQPSFILFYGDTIHISIDSSVYVDYQKPMQEITIKEFYQRLDRGGIKLIVDSILAYKRKNDLDDWIYYHLIRATAEKLSPKTQNYERYTLYKWYFLVKSGYASLLSITPEKILLYIQSDDDVFEIPTRKHNGQQYVCLNYHDYGQIDFATTIFTEVNGGFAPVGKPFSYVINKLPDFSSQRYLTKEIDFDYYQRDYKFSILVNPDVQKIFTNYPVLNYSYYFNMPMSRVTYGSLIPLLKKQLFKMDQRKGVDYLMHFTRYAFSYEPDSTQFGKEKRLSAEQTLLYNYSDCEDRAAFFFYMVKEIYDLPMIVLAYPKHVTLAINFGRKIGKEGINYKGGYYYVCEPSSQTLDLKIGEMLPELRKTPYQVVFEYKTEANTSTTSYTGK
jgi:hypothetical protein